MKTFALAALVAAGFFLTTGSADAQYRYRSSINYSAYRGSAIYNNPSFGYSGYNSGYTGVVGFGGTNVIIPIGGYSSSYTPNYGYSNYAPNYGYSNYAPNYGYNAYPSYNRAYYGGYGRRW